MNGGKLGRLDALFLGCLHVSCDSALFSVSPFVFLSFFSFFSSLGTREAGGREALLWHNVLWRAKCECIFVLSLLAQECAFYTFLFHDTHLNLHTFPQHGHGRALALAEVESLLPVRVEEVVEVVARQRFAAVIERACGHGKEKSATVAQTLKKGLYHSAHKVTAPKTRTFDFAFVASLCKGRESIVQKVQR